MSARWQRLSLAVVIAFAIADLVIVTHQSSLARRSADFTIDYSAALLIRRGHPDAIYQRDRLGPLLLQVSAQAIDPNLPFDAPLLMALPYLPLTFLPLEVAFHVWQLVTLALLMLSIWLMARRIPLGRRAPAIAALALVGFPATWALLSEGQSSAILLLGGVLLLGAWLRGSMLLACAGGLLLAMKPQYAPAYVILLLAARAWKPLLAALLGGLLTGLSPLLAGGAAGMTSMVASAIASGHGLIRYNESLIGTIAPFLPGVWPTYVGFGLWLLVLIALTAAAISAPSGADGPDRSERGDGLAMAVLMTSAGLIFAPHALPYDLVLVAVPMWLAFILHRRGQIPTPAPAGFAIAAAMVLDLGRPTISLTPVVMLACLVIYARLRRPAATPLARAA